MNEELERLMAQRSELDKKIRELKDIESTCGSAKYFVNNRRRGSRSTYGVKVKRTTHYEQGTIWSTVVDVYDREEILPAIQEIIDSLTDLKAKLAERFSR